MEKKILNAQRRRQLYKNATNIYTQSIMSGHNGDLNALNIDFNNYTKEECYWLGICLHFIQTRFEIEQDGFEKILKELKTKNNNKSKNKNGVD